jgi:hypothetical protein
MSPTRPLEHVVDRRRETTPVARLARELLSPLGREAVVLRAPVVLGRCPRRRDPAAVLEAVEGRVERSLVHLEHLARELEDPLRDAPPMHRFDEEGAKD